MNAFTRRIASLVRSKRLSGKAYHNLVARLERIEASQYLIRDTTGDAIKQEVGRLDKHHTHQLDHLFSFSGAFRDVTERLERIEASQSLIRAALSEAIRQEVDRLDGYLAYHHDHLLTCLNTHRESRLSYSSGTIDAILRTKEFDIVVPTTETGLLSYISRHGFENIETDVAAVIKAHVQPGANVIDVGSNIGVHALTFAAIVGSSGTVRCFEPAPHLATALERTLRLNGFGDRTHVHREAVSDKAGHTVFYRAHHGPMSSMFSLPDAMTAEEIQVPATTLDKCIHAGSRVDFIKIDAEGAEPSVWRGMRRIVAENPQLKIVLEWSSSHFQRSGCDPTAFMDDIRASGFKPHIIDARSDQELTRPLNEDVSALEGMNLFLTRTEQ